MLHQLYRYANDHNLAVKYGFKADKCKWMIELDESGNFLALRRIDREFPLCPKYPSNLMNAGGRAHFLLESFNKIKSSYFIDLLEQVSFVEPLFKAISVFLLKEDQMSLMRQHFTAQKAKEEDNVTFAVEGTILVQLDHWHEWWQSHIREISQGNKTRGNKDSSGDEMLCLLDGIPTQPVASHSKINIARAGGMAIGSVLVGFDKDAFSSYGLNASSNAAMSEKAVLTYTAALNHMIQNAPEPLGNVLILGGYDKPVPPEDDIFALFEGVNAGDNKTDQTNAEHRLKQLTDSVRGGERPNTLPYHYYVFLVSGASGRVMIRDYFEGDCVELVKSLGKWFDDLGVMTTKNAESNTPKLSALLTRLVTFREVDNNIFQRITDEVSFVVPAIWRSILTPSPLPDCLASKALAHIKARLLKTENPIPDTIACMWLKIWLIRGGTNMTKGLNRDEPSQAYQLGRLLAVYGKLQEDANPGINVGVGQRYFTSASTTPALVLGRLAALSNHHLAKLNEGSAIWYKQQLQEVASKISADLPATMSLKDQSLFALGYYHQMTDFYKSKLTKSEEE